MDNDLWAEDIWQLKSIRNDFAVSNFVIDH